MNNEEWDSLLCLKDEERQYTKYLDWLNSLDLEKVRAFKIFSGMDVNERTLNDVLVDERNKAEKRLREIEEEILGKEI